MIKRLPDIVFLIVVVIALFLFLVVIFSPSFSDWVVDLLGEDRQRIIQCIGWGIVAISVLWGLVAVNRWAGEQVVSYNNNSVERMKVIWEQVKVIGWWIWKKRLSIFLVLVGLIGTVFFVVLVLVMFNDCVASWAKRVLDSEHKRDAIKVIGLGIAGVLAIFGSVAVSKRANAQIKNNELVEKGHVQERFRAAVEHLSGRETARIASFYEFSHLARDNENLRRNIFDILCAYLRQTTADEKYKAKIGFTDEVGNLGVKPTEEVQSLLDILFQSESGERLVFAELKPNLRGSFLVGADLVGVSLSSVDFQGANLQRVDLQSSDLEWASFSNANLQGALLHSADLSRTNLCDANLQDAGLRSVNLRDAHFWRTDLRGADLQDASLGDVRFWDTKLLGANLAGADLSRANLHDMNLQGVNFLCANLQHANLSRANLEGACLRGADLRDADLRGVKNLETANLSEAKIKGATFPEEYEPLADVDDTSND